MVEPAFSLFFGSFWIGCQTFGEEN